MLKLNNLSTLVKKKQRVGRGGSRGGTAGRGHKGQRARTSGNVRPGFEGGQMPLFRRLPKRGFTNSPFQVDVEIINLNQLNEKFNDGDIITRQELVEKGLIHLKKGTRGVYSLVKVLAKGTLTKKLTITADAFSESAIQAIVDRGGEARLTKEN